VVHGATSVLCDGEGNRRTTRASPAQTAVRHSAVAIEVLVRRNFPRSAKDPNIAEGISATACAETRRVLVQKATAVERRNGPSAPTRSPDDSPTVAEVFAHYRSTLTLSKRRYADMKWGPIQHFWRAIDITEIAAQTFRDFYAWRRKQKTPQKTTITNHSLHKDRMVIRQILKFAVEEGHLPSLPAMRSAARKRSAVLLRSGTKLRP
jgi:hypothetical protein